MGVVSEHQWGRVDPDGTVYVRTAEGERPVGSYPGASEEEALAYFVRKFDILAGQVELLEQRLRAGQVSPADAEATAARLTTAVSQANAVGDLDSLLARLAALPAIIAERKAEAESAKAAARQAAIDARLAIVVEAEQISETDPERMPWKTAGDRLRELFDSWRTMQRENRLDKATEDELWHRFSHARTTFDRKRRQYFGALDEQRNAAKATKEAIVAEAEALSTSTDWGPTAAAYRGLMDRWKNAGRAARKDDDELWTRFRAAQDTFFAARTAHATATDSQFRSNLEAKEALLVEAEKLLPVSDPAAARAALRDIHDRWEAAGKVPRADMSRIEARLRRVEEAIREAEDRRWARTNPEARARAEAVVTQLETAIASLNKDLAAARASGNDRRAREAEQALQAREEWLAQARSALAEFGG